MQSVSSRIWTRVAVSISNDDNHDTTGTSTLIVVERLDKCVTFCSESRRRILCHTDMTMKSLLRLFDLQTLNKRPILNGDLHRIFKAIFKKNDK